MPIPLFRTTVKSTVLTLGLLSGLLTVSPQLTWAQGYQAYAPNRYDRQVRWPVDSAIEHLRDIAARNTYSHREMERYDNAMSHLSQFAEKMQRGDFDRGKLDRGISDVQNVLNKNPMDGRARDTLNNDLMELRRLRAGYQRGY
jgi:hypothetical protein